MIALCLLSLFAPSQSSAGHRPANLAGITVLADAASMPTTTSAPTSRPSLRDDPRAIRWRRTIFWSAIVIFIGLVGSVAIVRFSRRYAAYLKDGPPAPTASDDVWSMHRLPPEATDDDVGEEPTIDPDDSPDDDASDDEKPPPPI